MPTPADHLTAFVDRGGFDDATGARIRRAMAGESAPRFRDRLLLERAAWLARSTDRTLQDIAGDCGFRGYDVFVRAFRRELGASPSDWRAEPTTWEIDAPGEVHVHPPDGIVLPPCTSDDDSSPVGPVYVAVFSRDHTFVPLDEVPH